MRIRSIKPEFFDSPSTAEAGPWARLFYIAMWCMADDWGVGDANPKTLAAGAFPNDEQWTGKEVPCLCKEVADTFGVIFYTYRGRRYYQIPSWEDHQITQRRAKRRFPTYDDPESTLDQAVHELPSVDKEVPCELKEDASTEQGNRGTGEQGNRGTYAQPSVARVPSRFPDWWTIWEKKKAKGDAEKAYKTAVPKKISHDDLMTKTRAYWDHVKATGTDMQYVPYPATWLRAEQWDDDLTAPTPTRNRGGGVGLQSQMDALRYYEGN